MEIILNSHWIVIFTRGASSSNEHVRRLLFPKSDGWQSQLYPFHRKWSKEQVTTPQERRPTGICSGALTVQHLHLRPANHHLQKVCICWRRSNHECWWRLAGGGRGADQRHGNARWIPPDLEAEAQHHKTVSAVFHLNNKEAKCELKVNFNNKTLPFCPEPKYLGVTLDRSLTKPTPWVTSQEASVTRHTPEATCWLRWSAGATTLRRDTLALVDSTAEYCAPVWCAVLIPALPTPPSATPCELWLDACVLHQRQPSNPRRHSTCWASPQWSHTISSTPCHGAWTSAPLSAPLSVECCCTAPHIETPICTRRTTTHQLLWQRGVGGQPGTLHSGMTLPRRAWVRLNRLRTGVGRFRSCLYKRGMASSAVCEFGAEEQTVDHVVLQCPIHRPPHGLMVLDDETTKWLLNTCPEI